MALEPGVDLVEGIELLDRKVSAQGKHGVERNRRVPLAEDQAISIGRIWLRRIDSELVEVERDEDIRDGERPADVAGTRLVDRLKDQATRASRECLEFRDGFRVAADAARNRHSVTSSLMVPGVPTANR